MLAPRCESAFHTFLSLTSWWLLLPSPRNLTLFYFTQRIHEKTFVKSEHVNPTAYPTDCHTAVLGENFRQKRKPGWAVG